MRRLLLLVGLTVLGALLFASVALAQTTPPFVQEAETAAMVANEQITAAEACARGMEEFCLATASATATSTAAATPTATATPSATATASSTATASAATAAGGSLPATGGPTAPLMGIGALLLLTGAGIMSFRIVRRSS